MPAKSDTITMNVSLSEPLKQYVDGRVSSGIYSSASEFVREAIREKLQRDQDRLEAKSILTEKLLRGVKSGKPVSFTDSLFPRKKAALARRLGRSAGTK